MKWAIIFKIDQFLYIELRDVKICNQTLLVYFDFIYGYRFVILNQCPRYFYKFFVNQKSVPCSLTNLRINRSASCTIVQFLYFFCEYMEVKQFHNYNSLVTIFKHEMFDISRMCCQGGQVIMNNLLASTGQSHCYQNKNLCSDCIFS